MNEFILNSSIEKIMYDREIVIRNNNDEIIRIKILNGLYFQELSFYVSDFWGIWTKSKKIIELLKTLDSDVIVAECLGREYVLRLWLRYIGFKKQVLIPNYYCINEKEYDYLIYVFGNKK